MKPMTHTLTHNETYDGVIAVVTYVFAAIFSWQEQVEWVLRVTGLFLAACVSAYILYGHVKKHLKK